MTQRTALSPFMLNGKRLTIKDAEEIASEVMEHAIRRNLKCKWDKCGLIYGSIHLLERHIRREHISKMVGTELGPSKAGTSTRAPRNLQCGFKQCTTKADTVYSTTSDLLNHINSKHLEDIKWDCYICNVHPPDAIEMLEHLRDRHGIPISNLHRSPFRKSHTAAPPPIPDPCKPPTYKIITPTVEPSAGASRRRCRMSDKWAFLEDETPELEEIREKQRAMPNEPLLLDSVMTDDPDSRAFYAMARPAPPPTEKGLVAPPQFIRPPLRPLPKDVNELAERMKQAKVSELSIIPESVGFLILRKRQEQKPEFKRPQSPVSDKRPKR